MGTWSNQDIHYCPVCEKDTDMITHNDNDDTGTHTHCCECEYELPLPEVKYEEPFIVGNKVHMLHIGSDDEVSLTRWHDE
jgi:hypothetical protein